MKTKADFRQCTLSLIQMIEDKSLWRESLTEDDREYINTLKSLAKAGTRHE